jgi:hypothetical protein
LEAYLDLRDAKRGIPDDHTKDVWAFRTPAMFIVSAINVLAFPNEFVWWVHGLQSLGLSFALFVLCFDMAFGIGFKGNPFYLGTSSKTDQWLSKLRPHEILAMRLIIFSLFILIYTQLDYALQ